MKFFLFLVYPVNSSFYVIHHLDAGKNGYVKYFFLLQFLMLLHDVLKEVLINVSFFALVEIANA